MARVYVTAEGKTEQAFAVNLLQPHLAGFGVFLTKPRPAAIGRKKGRVHRGGVVRYLPFKEDLQRWLREDRSPDLRFTTMIDLYALPRDFPGTSEADKVKDIYARVAALEDALARDIADDRFIPYVQLHEFEALLLSDPRAFACRYAGHRKAIEALCELCRQYKSPELIDDNQNTAPSKRIGREIPEYLAAKATAGPIIAMDIGLQTIRAKCPHFHQWLTKLEGLATLSAESP